MENFIILQIGGLLTDTYFIAIFTYSVLPLNKMTRGVHNCNKLIVFQCML